MGELTATTVPVEQGRATIEDRLILLAEAGAALSSSLDVETTLGTVAHLAVPRLADWCAVHLIRDDGAVDQLAVAHVDPAKVAWARELQEHYPFDPNAPRGVANVLRTGRPELYAEITDDLLVAAARNSEHLEILRRVGFRSAMIAPMSARGATVGTITFATAESGRHYTKTDQVLAMELAHRAAVAVDNARLYRASQAAEARYRNLFEGLADAVIVSDDQGNYIEVNAALCDMLGYTREELLAAKVGDLSVAPEIAFDLYRRIQADGSLRGENVPRRKDGSHVPIEVWSRRVELPTRPVNLGMMRDISERKNLERTHQMHLASIAHDLKNPISALTVQAQLLTRYAARIDAVDADRLRTGLARVEAIGRRLASQVDELQDIARPRGGQPIELEREPTDLVRLAAQVADEYRQTAEHHTIRVEAAARELTGYWDATRLERVLANILTNAIKYSDGGEIGVRVTRTEGDAGPRACVSVEDQGAGIPAGDLPHIFEPFRRGANVAGVVGNGMGLAGVRHIVEQHGGTVGVESREGVGSTFTVCLPLGNEDGEERR
ncbi:MAG: ATP-binding protein [Thermomicrobiales bacterium]